MRSAGESTLLEWMMSKPESELRHQIIEIARCRRWFATTVKSDSMNGIMDCVFIRRGRTVWMETKKKDETARRQQDRRAQEMRDHGAEVHVIDTIEAAILVLR